MKYAIVKKQLLTSVVASIALLIGGCGGGGGGEELRCSDFKYQEDAQQAFRSGASQLDGDDDGIACEALPSKPNNTPTQPSTSFQSVSFLTRSGYLVQVNQTGSAYSATFSTSGVSSTSNANVTTDGNGVIQVSAAFNTLKYTRINNRSHVGWMPHESQNVGVTALGFDNSDLAQLSSLIGAYKLLGQRCVPNTSNCEAVVATASISALGAVEICFGEEFSNSCSLRASGVFLSPGSDGVITSWTGGRLIGSISNSSIGLTYNNTQINPSNQKTAYSLFGYKEAVVQALPVEFSNMTTFVNNGLIANGMPNVAQWQVSSNSPLTGFFSDSSGRLYLRSIRGQLIAWSNDVGLQHFSNSQ